jgi:hypothetical protein
MARGTIQSKFSQVDEDHEDGASESDGNEPLKFPMMINQSN